MTRRVGTLLLLLGGLSTGDGHKSAVTGVSCGAQFSSPASALTLPNSEDLWGAERVVTCDAPVFWVNLTIAGTAWREAWITAGSHKPQSRFDDQRIDAVVLHP